MAKNEFMAALPGGLEALGGIASEIIAPGNPMGFGLIAKGVGGAINGVNSFDDQQKMLAQQNLPPQMPIQPQTNNNQINQPTQQFTQMPTQNLGGNQTLGASQYYGIPTGGMPQYMGGVPSMSPQSLQYGQQQFSNGGTVTNTRQPLSATQYFGIPVAQYKSIINENVGSNTTWNPHMSFANGGRVGYADGSIGIEGNTTMQMPDIGQGTTNTTGNTGSGFGGYMPYASAGLGLAELGLGLHGLNQLTKQAMPQYIASSQLNTAYNRANKMAEMGFTPEEIASFHGNLAQANNTAYQNAIQQGGGNLAGAINAGIQSQNIGALNQFAGQDAALKRANMQYANSFAPQFQNIQDENTRAQLQQRLMREQALGGAAQAGLSNLAGSFNLAQATRAGNPQ